MATVDQLGGLHEPPAFCQYADGPCDQSFAGVAPSTALFLYASEPTSIAGTIETAVEALRDRAPNEVWRTWRDLPIHGQIIFCEVCKASRFSSVVVADVTTLNFNLLFEIGFAIGLGLPVLPIRDSNYGLDRKAFEELGLLDTLGYLDFTNGSQLADLIRDHLPTSPLPQPPARTFTENPLYVVRGPTATEGVMRMMSTLKKSALRFRTYDPVETPRLSLFEARRQVGGSVGVVANLLDPARDGASVHNGRAALICGIAMAQQKVVVMCQEGDVRQPIDYRDVVKHYTDPRDLPALLEYPIRQVVENMQRASHAAGPVPTGLLEKVDLGDTAAENEITTLPDYFVRTGQFRQALQGHARLVIGRKGAGKTALFYEIRQSIGISRSTLVLDLKPEGHQFTKLREAVLDHLGTGLREHIVTAFWNYILLVEIAHTVLRHEHNYAQRDHQRFERYMALNEAYLDHAVGLGDDLSQRLNRQVDRIVERFGDIGPAGAQDCFTELMYGGDIRTLDDAVSAYLREKDSVWLLIDNLDKGWPTRGTDSADILLLRGLLEATRKLQRQMEGRDVDFRCLVFLRTDVFEHLLSETPDKGKDTAIRLDWDDPAVFQEIVRKRIETSTGVSGAFREIWPEVAESHIGAEDSFNYLLDRTLMRPRDLLTFLQRAVEVALNRGHRKVMADDIRQAENSYSEDMLLALDFEVKDTSPGMEDVLYAFLGAPGKSSYAEMRQRLVTAKVPDEQVNKTVELLLWFGFLGIDGADGEPERYSHEVRYNLKRLLAPVSSRDARFVVHPAFRRALEMDDGAQLAFE